MTLTREQVEQGEWEYAIGMRVWWFWFKGPLDSTRLRDASICLEYVQLRHSRKHALFARRAGSKVPYQKVVGV